MDKTEKLELVRCNIVKAAKVYKKMVGKSYLYIYDSSYFEARYKINNFMHLAGVDSKGSAKSFYQKASLGTLKRSDIKVDSRHPLRTALNKSDLLSNLDMFVNTSFFVVQDFRTQTMIYKFCFSDHNLTLGFTKETDRNYYIPRTFRVNEDIYDDTKKDEIFDIKFIFSKIDDFKKYSSLEYGDKEKIIDLPEK